MRTSAQDRRLAAIGEAAAAVLRRTEYHAARAEDVAAAVQLPADSRDRRSGSGRRSAVWLHNEVRSRRVLVCLATYHAWCEYLERVSWTPPVHAPATLTDGCIAVSRTLQEVARFHHAERFLIIQANIGIGDIATSEKRARADAQSSPPQWAESPWGLVASEGWSGRCAAFADALAPVLHAAAATVVPLSVEAAERGARVLSNAAFRTFAVDFDTPVDRLADGLAAYWFERELVDAAGLWVRDLYSAEHMLAMAQRRGTNPRSEASARESLIWGLLHADTGHARGAREGAELVERLGRLTRWLPNGASADADGDGPHGELADLRALCDAASRRGFALSRLGDLAAAAGAYQMSRRVAEELGELEVADGDPDEATSFVLRADHNLAEVACESGRPMQACAGLERVHAARARLFRSAPSDAAWRRLSLTADSRARAASAAGMVVKGVRYAEELVEDRRARLGGVSNLNTAAARVTLGEALLAAGQPVEARHHIEEALRFRATRRTPASYGQQYDQVRLAQVVLVLGEPDRACDLLIAAPATGEWFAENVSFRLGLEARRTLALARAALAEDGIGDGIDRLRALADQLPAHPVLTIADPLWLALRRDLGDLLRRAGDAEGSRALLTEVAAMETGVDDNHPQRSLTLLLLARCADVAGDRHVAEDCFSRSQGVVEQGVDPEHPVLLEGRFDQAKRRIEAGDLQEASRLLDPLLDRAPLGHGRPALGDGHPLLAAAQALARRIGARRVDRGYDLSWQADL